MVGTSNQMALNPRDGRQTMAERMQFSCVRETNWAVMSQMKQKAEKKREGIRGGRDLCSGCLDSSHYGEAVYGTCCSAGTVLGRPVLEQQRWYRYRVQQVLGRTPGASALHEDESLKASVRWRVNAAEAQPLKCPLVEDKEGVASQKSKRGQGCEESSTMASGEMEICMIYGICCFLFFFSGYFEIDVDPLSIAAVLVQARRLRRQ
ncbi:hypothetical protein HDV63DRAFT_203559 [Trichoderma sp. SZMC 28014]